MNIKTKWFCYSLLSSVALAADPPQMFYATGASLDGATQTLAKINLQQGHIYSVRTHCLAKRTDGPGAAKMDRELTLLYEGGGQPVPVLIETIGQDYNPNHYDASLTLDGKFIDFYIVGAKGHEVHFNCDVKWWVK